MPIKNLNLCWLHLAGSLENARDKLYSLGSSACTRHFFLDNFRNTMEGVIISTIRSVPWEAAKI